MPLSRRQILIGAAATVAAAALPAVAMAEVAIDEYGADAMEVLRRLWPEGRLRLVPQAQWSFRVTQVANLMPR